MVWEKYLFLLRNLHYLHGGKKATIFQPGNLYPGINRSWELFPKSDQVGESVQKDGDCSKSVVAFEVISVEEEDETEQGQHAQPV